MIPGYVTTRNEQAIAAGLTIERQTLTGDRLTTWYTGTEAAWRASPFCRREKPFVSRIGGTMDSGEFTCYAPCDGRRGEGRFTVHTKGPDRYRGVLSNERMPEWTDEIGDGITAYGVTGHGGPAVVYVGDLDAIKARRLAPAELFDSSKRRDLPRWAYEYDRLADGRAIVVDNVAHREHLASEAAERSRKAATTPAEHLASWRQSAAAWLEMLMDEHKQVETKGRQIYTVTPDSLTAIRDAAGDLLQAIADATVRVRESDPHAAKVRELAKAAQADGAFRAFMGSVRNATPAGL